MKALVFGVDPDPVEAPPEDAPRLVQHLATTPMAIQEIDDPKLLGPDWAVLDTRLSGVCGSDTKQILMDFEDGGDSPMTALITFPQVLGHEVIATVAEAGPELTGIETGQRVVLNPWLSCAPRGIDPPCPACQAGDLSLCWNFTKGRLAAGIHSGNSADATGGFAEKLPAHQSMMFPVPDGMPDEVAVLADPFSVSLHAITRNPPPESGRVVVYGSGALGTTANAILHALYPGVEVATVAAWPAQAALAERLGATVFHHEPAEAVIGQLAEWSGAGREMLHPWEGLPLVHPGHIDVVYDTVGSPRTVEIDMRVLASKGRLVQLGVSAPGRFEWTPWYFKELRLLGSNAFGVEQVEGVRKHAMEHYFDLVTAGRIDLSGMLTHEFRLDEWRSAIRTLIDQGETGAIKVAFDFR